MKILAEAAVVQVAFDILEVAPKKVLIVAFDHDVESEVASVENDGGVFSPWGGNSCGIEQFATESLRDVGRILG